MISAHLQEYALEKFQERKKYYGPVWKDIMDGLMTCTPEEAVLMRFLYGTMPARDAGEYGFDIFLSYVRHSLWLRENVEWCKTLPEDIFVHHVLYYRINSEDIGDCRPFFYEQIKDRIQGLSLEEAVVEINYWCAEHAVYEATDGRTAAPVTLFECGKGRCGEESTFAVTAYRSAGIAARQVYTPRWSHCDDNHAWVEVYLHGEWRFLGACEPEEALDTGWFTGPASRAILIHSRTFSDFVSTPSEEYIGREDLLIYYNNTARYAKVCELCIRVKDGQGRPVSGAHAAVEILNMAEYYPAAVMETDEQGEARITVGRGDIHIRAFANGCFAEKTVSAGECKEAGLVLEPAFWQTIPDEWATGLLRAPEEFPMHPDRQTGEQRERNERRLARAAKLREERFAQSSRMAAGYPEEEQILRTAGNHCREILRFLEKDDNPDRKRLLHSLALKDYKDLKAAVLEDHLDCARDGLPEEIYVTYVLCPRIYLEELTPYRSYIRSFFTEEEKSAFREDPGRIWTYIAGNIGYAPEVDYKTICATPVGCLKMKQGNPLAQKILFVAICRSLGIPARLNRVNMLPEYREKDTFVLPAGLAADGDGKRKACLTLAVEDRSKWNYYQTWTIGRLCGTAFITLDYEGLKFGENRLKLELESGVYRLITALRLPNGDQSVSTRVFSLKDGEDKYVEMALEDPGTEEMLTEYPLPELHLTGEDGKPYSLSKLGEGKILVLAFLGVGAEPTEHVLNELKDCAMHWNGAGAGMLAVLKKPQERDNLTLQKTLREVSGIRLYYADREETEKAAGAAGVDPEKLPVLIIVKDGKTGIYSCAGYNVGSVDLMLKILRREETEGRQ